MTSTGVITGLSGSRLGHQLARIEGATKITPRSAIVPAVATGLLGAVVVANQRRALPQNKTKSVIRDICVSAGILGGLLAGMAFYKTRWASKIIRGLSRMLGREVPPEHQVKNIIRQDLGDRIGELFKINIRDKGVKGFVKLESLALGGILGGIGGGIVGDWLNKEDLKRTVPQKINEGIFQFLGNITFLTFSMLALATGGKVVGKQLLKGSASKQKQAAQAVVSEIRQLAKTEDALALVPTNITKRVATLMKDHARHSEAFRQNLGSYLKRELGETPHKTIDSFVHSLDDVFSWGSRKDVIHKVQRFYAAQMRKDIKTLSEKLGNAKTLDDITDPAARATVEKLATLKAENKGEWFGVLGGLVAGLLGGVWTSNQVNEHLSGKKGRSLFPIDDGFSAGEGWYLGKSRNKEGTPWWENLINIRNWPSMLYLAGARSLESLVVVMYAISGYFAGTAGTDYSNPFRSRQDMALYTQSAPLNRNSRVFGQFQTAFKPR